MSEESTFLQRAFSSYDNPHCITIEEFESDLMRFSYIRKALTMYENSQVVNERLLLNNITICFNLFGDNALHLLLSKTDKEQWKYLFPFLYFLNRVPEVIPDFGIVSEDIELDMGLMLRLKNLLRWQE